ncbi:MAG: hypothetical protein GY822_06785 [Deltaproteobacteria bacterium]|nr:hypothetical protein [Deltaproteobacteria bacterium]
MFLQACGEILEGTASQGTPCFAGWMCADGLECSYDVTPREFRCLAPGLVGEACSSSSTHNYKCSEGLECVDDICSAPLAEGDNCGDSNGSCGPGLRCDYGGSDNCIVDDNACMPDCEGNQTCFEGACVDLPVLDEACDDGDQCAGNCIVCRPNAQGATFCLDRGDVGESCTQTNHYRKGTFCSNDVCAAEASVGGDCSNDDECAKELTCLNDLCAEKPACWASDDCAAGDICSFDSDCNDGLLCVSDACVAAPAPGEACINGYHCADDAYCDDQTQCALKKAEDEICVEDGECSTGHCSDGTCAPPGQSCLNSKDLFASFMCFSLLFVPGQIRRRRKRQEISQK